MWSGHSPLRALPPSVPGPPPSVDEQVLLLLPEPSSYSICQSGDGNAFFGDLLPVDGIQFFLVLGVDVFEDLLNVRVGFLLVRLKTFGIVFGPLLALFRQCCI
jgi:hypothetical protein